MTSFAPHALYHREDSLRISIGSCTLLVTNPDRVCWVDVILGQECYPTTLFHAMCVHNRRIDTTAAQRLTRYLPYSSKLQEIEGCG